MSPKQLLQRQWTCLRKLRTDLAGAIRDQDEEKTYRIRVLEAECLDRIEVLKREVDEWVAREEARKEQDRLDRARNPGRRTPAQQAATAQRRVDSERHDIRYMSRLMQRADDRSDVSTLRDLGQEMSERKSRISEIDD